MVFVKRLIVFLIIVIVLLIIGYLLQLKSSGRSVANSTSVIENSVEESGIVTRVVDGDTIHVNIRGKDETIRLLGINTPEKKKSYYFEARKFLIDNIENKSVQLVVDRDNVDKYRRRLRYIFYENRLINVEIVENGLATTFMLDSLKYREKFINAEKFARTNEKGLWRKSSDKCASCIKLVLLNETLDYFIIKNNCDFYCNLNNWSVKDDANHFFIISDLNGFEERKYDSLELFKTEVWNDNGDRFFMRDSAGRLVIFYEYV
jgi:micrococcal nuclease